MSARPSYEQLFELHKGINEMIHTAAGKLVSIKTNETSKYPMDLFLDALEQAAGDVCHALLNRDMQFALDRLNASE